MSKFERIEEKFLDMIFTLYSLDYDEEQDTVRIGIEGAEWSLDIPAEEFLETDPEELGEKLLDYTSEILEDDYETEEGDEEEATEELETEKEPPPKK